MTTDLRFSRGLFSHAEAARFVGMPTSTLRAWAQSAVVSTVESSHGNRTIPFVGLVEATVVQAFRRTGLPMQRIRRALEVLDRQGELPHALASERLFSDGANVLYNYAVDQNDRDLEQLTVVVSGQRVFEEVISRYLERISFEDEWAGELVLPVTKRRLLRVLPEVAYGKPLFINGGAPWDAVRSRFLAGESIDSIAKDYCVPPDEVKEALDALESTQQAA